LSSLRKVCAPDFPFNCGIRVKDEFGVKERYFVIDELERKAREQAVIENLKPACLCNKIRKGTVLKAIQAGAKTFEQVSKRTGVGTGPCGGRRCGTMVRGMLGEPIVSCKDCGWPVLVGPSPQVCPRCEYAKQEGSF
jgi:bacterioferritin-associated ferredoxin